MSMFRHENMKGYGIMGSLMRYRFYTTSESAWRGMLQAIGAARESIYMEMYMFHDDTQGFDFLMELERKAREGLRVIVILDAFGSFDLETSLIERLKAAGAEVRFFSYWFRRTHRKILLVDETTVFVGGVNIARHAKGWRDLQIRLSGKIVRPILHSFARIYRECGGKDPALPYREKLPLLKKTRLWFIEHGVGKKRHILRKHYEAHIDGAEHSITLVTPYLLPHPWLISCLHRAILRGVSVEIVAPKHTDHRIMDRLNYHYFVRFTQLGARCLLTEHMNHAKVMVIDEKKATVGSHNIDALSFDWNVESGVMFNDPKMLRHLKKIIGRWKMDAKIFHARSDALPWYDALLAFMLRIFQPVL